MWDVRLTDLPLQTAAAQLLVFSLETLGFSQDGVDLEVDHVGHLPSNRNGNFSVLWRSDVSVLLRSDGWNLRLSGADGDELEHLPALVVGVEHLHGVLGRLLHLSWLGTPLEPAAQQRNLLWVQETFQKTALRFAVKFEYLVKRFRFHDCIILIFNLTSMCTHGNILPPWDYIRNKELLPENCEKRKWCGVTRYHRVQSLCSQIMQYFLEWCFQPVISVFVLSVNSTEMRTAFASCKSALCDVTNCTETSLILLPG